MQGIVRSLDKDATRAAALTAGVVPFKGRCPDYPSNEEKLEECKAESELPTKLKDATRTAVSPAIADMSSADASRHCLPR